jgi:hypothetical protein
MRTISKIGPWPAIVAAFYLSLSLAAGAGAQDKKIEEKYAALLGTWDARTENGAYTFVFEFFLKEGSLKGTYTGSAGSTEMRGLSFENNIVRFSVTVNGIDLDYTAAIDGDKLKGEVTLQYGQADISGEKRKKYAGPTL